MQRYSNPDVFLCPTYNVPGIANPKMHISEDGRPDKTPRYYPGLGSLTTPWSPSSSPSSPNSPSPEPSSPDSDYDRKVQDYDRIFEELINVE
ncbi:hypothetical protein LXA43DRAFT_1100253 [Ganoderma leucocontextum]|nr:hypothetical protein LXA43DRAFT_1100253 [Ganoderma leucocontextum]